MAVKAFTELGVVRKASFFTQSELAARQARLDARHASEKPGRYSHSRDTGFPVGGHYAIDEHGKPMRKPDSKYGDLPPRFPTPEKAEAFGLQQDKKNGYKASRQAGESTPVPAQRELNDDPVPVEHTSPEDVSPAKPEEGKETLQHEVERIDPDHYRSGTEPKPVVAAMHDDLPQDGEESEAKAGDDDGEEDGPFESAVPLRKADAPPGGAPAPDAPPPSAPADAAPSPPAAPGGAPPTPGAPAAPGGPDKAPAAPGSGAAPVFDFENGLDPTAKGHLTNDWQQDVDPKLFARHTNVIGLSAKGNTVSLKVQAYNTDTSTKPDIGTGYAADGVQRGELMMHLREVFQPNGPAVKHISTVYNDFIEGQADAGVLKLVRLKVLTSEFKFNANQRSIEGWADAGVGKEPKWQSTPYTVFVVDFSLTFGPIGS